MRDIFVTLLFVGFVPSALSRPHVGVLLWTWIGLMNPHRLGWGFAQNLPFAMAAAAVTFIALFVSREPKRLPLAGPVVVLIIFDLWMTLTTILALYPESAWEIWSKVMKIQLFILITLAVMQSKERVVALVWVSTLCLGFFGVKGGIFVLTGGGGMVLGPPESYIEGNTEIALALTMTIPLMRWLQVHAGNPWVRRGMLAAMGLTALAILGSFSRGGLLAIAAMAFFLWLKSPRKIIGAIAFAAFIPVALTFMPAEWFERMSTIRTYQEDASALGRLNAWSFALNLTAERPFAGGGFETFQPGAFLRYAPNPLDHHDAHSIWFEVLGEQGYVGLFLFMLLWLLTWLTANAVLRMTKGRAESKWASDLARMIQVSLVGYWVGGSFLGLAYWDYPYILMSVLVLTRLVVAKEIAASETSAKVAPTPMQPYGVYGAGRQSSQTH